MRLVAGSALVVRAGLVLASDAPISTNITAAVSGGIRNSSNPRAMDAHRGNLGCSGRNMAGSGASWGPMGFPLAGNHRWRSRNVRTGYVVN